MGFSVGDRVVLTGPHIAYASTRHLDVGIEPGDTGTITSSIDSDGDHMVKWDKPPMSDGELPHHFCRASSLSPFVPLEKKKASWLPEPKPKIIKMG